MMLRTNPPEGVALGGVSIVLRLWQDVRHCDQKGGLPVTNPGPFEAKAPRCRDRGSPLGCVEEQRMRLQGSRVPGPGMPPACTTQIGSARRMQSDSDLGCVHKQSSAMLHMHAWTHARMQRGGDGERRWTIPSRQWPRTAVRPVCCLADPAIPNFPAAFPGRLTFAVMLRSAGRPRPPPLPLVCPCRGWPV